MPGLDGFRHLSEEPRFRGHVFSVSTLRLADPDGREFTRDIVRHPGAVSVVPLHEDGTVTLVRQLRVAVGETVLEAPAGTCDVAGEVPEATARRELAEEAGLRAGRLDRLGAVYNSPGYTSQRTIVYLATGLEGGQRTEPAGAEEAGAEERWMTTETVRLDDVDRLVSEGRLVDSTTIVGLLLARGFLASGADRPPS